jgi:hypothetical protein
MGLVGVFYGRLEYFTAIWYILSACWQFSGNLVNVLVYFVKKNLATLLQTL